MKIICTVTNDLNFDQRMIRICTSLSRAGNEVLLLGRELPASKPLTATPFQQKRLNLLFQKGKLFYLEFNLRLLFFLLFSRFDVVYSVDLDSLTPGFLIARLKGKPCVYDAHEYFSEVPEVARRPVVKKIWEAGARLIVPRLQYCLTVGETLAAVFQERYGVPFEVVRNVPFKSDSSGAKAKPWKENQTFILLYQGALNEGRGLEEIIGAMTQLPEVELWLAGEGDLSDELREKVRELALEEKVHFLGKLKPDELSKITPQAWLGLNLLKNSGLSYYYSLANKAFDYIQAGLPSLSMDFPEYRRLDEQYHVFYLLKELSESAIAEAVLHLKKERALYEKLAGNCQKAAGHLTWENEEKRLLAFFQKIK